MGRKIFRRLNGVATKKTGTEQCVCVKEMETESYDAVPPKPQVNATFRLGTESYSVQATNGSSLSEQLVNMKEQSMAVLKDFITKHNVPHDVPDELLEGSSEDDDVAIKPQVKSKKTKFT